MKTPNLAIWQADVLIERNPHLAWMQQWEVSVLLEKIFGRVLGVTPGRKSADPLVYMAVHWRLFFLLHAWTLHHLSSPLFATLRNTNRVFHIRITTVGHRIKIGYFCLEDPKMSAAALGRSDAGWIPGETIPDAFLASAVPLPNPTERAPPVRACGKNSFHLARYGDYISRFTQLKPPSNTFVAAKVHDLHRPVAAEVSLDLCGLWCAPYGNHGLEIIQISEDAPEGLMCEDDVAVATAAESSEVGPLLDAVECGDSQETTSSSASVCTSRAATDEDSDYDDHDMASEDDDNDVEADSAYAAREARERCSSNATVHNDPVASRNHPRLFGTKVTGDANVPAGELSFAVAMDKICDINEELEADRRSVILFTTGGAVMADLSNRRSSIALWRKGRGQINRTPGQWNPEWVDVDFVAYQPLARCAFSVVFKQPSQAFRVILDFERVLGTKEAWPEWSSVVADCGMSNRS